MKRLFAIGLAVLVLCACGKGGEKEPAAEQVLPSTPTGYALEYGGVRFGIGMDAQVVTAQLGPCECVVTESCGSMGGNDYEYPYQDFVIYANDGNGPRRIYCVEIISDQMKTSEDIAIGDTVDDVMGVYGDPDGETDSALVYEKGGMQLMFILKDGEVTSIQYLAK